MLYQHLVRHPLFGGAASFGAFSAHGAPLQHLLAAPGAPGGVPTGAPGGAPTAAPGGAPNAATRSY